MDNASVHALSGALATTGVCRIQCPSCHQRNEAAGRIDPMAAAFVEPASVAMHGLFLMDFKPCTDIAIMGVGTIGNLVLQAAKIMGARHIYAFDSDDERLALAEKSGAYRCYNTSDPSFLDAFLADTGGLGVENVVEAVGKEVTINNCIKIAKVNGRISLIGTMNEDVTIPPELFYQGFSRKQLSMHGVWMSYSDIFPESHGDQQPISYGRTNRCEYFGSSYSPG